MGGLTITDLPHDMTKEEKEQVLEFIQNGVPGLLRVQHSDMYTLFKLYMSGKTYSEIATISKINKTLVMYLSYKSSWLDKRFKHYEDISLNILDKVQKTKLDIANKLVTMINATGKFLEDEYNQYLKTNDKAIIQNIDSKIISGYHKSIDSLKRVLDTEEENDPNKKPKQPLVNINVGMGAQIQQGADRPLEISDATTGDLIKALASMKKAAESK